MLASLTLVIALSLAACGGADSVPPDDGSAQDATPDPSGAPAAPDPAAERAAAEAAAPHAGPPPPQPYVPPTDAEIDAACRAAPSPPTGPWYRPPDWYLAGDPAPAPSSAADARREADLAAQAVARRAPSDPDRCTLSIRLGRAETDAGRTEDAMRSYATVIQDHASCAEIPDALFRLAALLMRQGDPQRARQLYLQLIRNHPSSRLIPYAYLSFADYYFHQGDMSAALQFYQRVLAFPDPALRPYVLYMTGWAHLNLQDRVSAETAWRQAFRAAAAIPPPPLAREIGSALKEALCTVRAPGP